MSDNEAFVTDALEPSPAQDPADIEPPEPVVAPPRDATQEPLASVAQAIARLEQAVAERLAFADRSATVIDRLHDEVQRHRKREDARRVEPMLRALVHLRDDIQAIADAADHPDHPATRDDLRRSLDNFRLQVEEFLYREGAEPFEPEIGGMFDAQRHRVILAIPVDDPSRDRTVVATRQPGFTYDERVLRPALVNVARHVPSPSTQGD